MHLAFEILMVRAEKKKKLKVGIIVTMTLLIAAIFVYKYKRLSAALNLVSPRIGPVVEAVYGLGTVIAPETYQIKTAINQSIHEIYVKEGDKVKKGDLLLGFDESGIKRASFAGTVTSIPFKRGELVFPQVAVLTLVNLNNLYLEVSLEQQSVLSVKEGQLALVSFESLRADKLQGKVRSIFPRENQFIVRIDLDHFPEGVLPGMTADVAIEVARKDNVLSVPLRAISAGRVTIERDGKRTKEPIQVGVVDGEWAEVTSGNIKPNDRIFVRSE